MSLRLRARLSSPGLSFLFSLLLLLLAGAPVAQAEDFYVDPEAGSMDGDGSAARPWRTLEEVFAAGLVETHHWDTLPYEPGAGLSTVNPGAPVGAGDTIWLLSGYHGDLTVQGGYNPDAPITIAAAEGERPTLGHVLLRAASGWVLRGLTISASFAPEYDNRTLLDIDNHGYHGPSSDIRVEGCELFSVDDISGWSAADWVAMAANGVAVDGHDVEIVGNVVRNIRFGISVGGQRALISRNEVTNFSGDGLRGLGDGDVFEYNLVRNCYDVDDNHDDGFQSWSVGADGVGTGVVRDLVLRGNMILNYSDPEQPLRGPLQGIGCFDGFFEGWVVENNVIAVDHWHGITLLGARNSRIVNNTVIDLNTDRPGPPWIQIGLHKDGRPSTDVIVRNNLVTDLNIDADQPTVSEDHNLVISDLAAHFVDPIALDLHLLPTSEAIDMGLADLAPDIDRDGIPRPQGAAPDLGAYEWHDGTVMPADAGPPVGRDAGPPSSTDGGAARQDAGGPAGPGEEGGCGCRAAGAASGGQGGAGRWGAALGLLLLLGAAARRRRGSTPLQSIESS